ncbi:MAG: hypothetical protein K6G42_07705 [Lachnospiraceae bacterium]|nr:hypothetical protein [Lachnospiraceae bacterium]
MPGKAKCRILKEIRQKIADENDIPYVTRECTYQGECSGTCPRCESELRYLERELERRTRLGKSVAVTALCAGLSLAALGCGKDSPLEQEVVLSGEVAEDEWESEYEDFSSENATDTMVEDGSGSEQ